MVYVDFMSALHKGTERDYLSRVNDPDFPKEFPFALLADSTDAPVDMGSVREFFAGLDRSDLEARMRDYAESKLSWRAKLSPVFDFVCDGDVRLAS